MSRSETVEKILREHGAYSLNLEIALLRYMVENDRDTLPTPSAKEIVAAWLSIHRNHISPEYARELQNALGPL